LAAILDFWSIAYKRILEITGISEMALQMWAAVLRDFLFPCHITAGKMLILLGDESTIYQYYWRHAYKVDGLYPICQWASNKIFFLFQFSSTSIYYKILQFVEFSPRFVSVSSIRYYRKLENCCQICKSIPKIPAISEIFLHERLS